MLGSDVLPPLRERLAVVQDRIAYACARAGRDSGSVRLVAASKTVAPEVIRAAAEAGVRCFGENRVQERAAKREALADLDVEWRLIGALQSNKAGRALELFDSVDSVASLDLARRLDRLAGDRSRRLPILIEVNIGREERKAGVWPEAALDLATEIGALAALDCRGVMGIPPAAPDAEASRPWLAALADVSERLRARLGRAVSGWQLSMGMSHDYEVAIEEGATMIRLGSALFGQRQG